MPRYWDTTRISPTVKFRFHIPWIPPTKFRPPVTEGACCGTTGLNPLSSLQATYDEGFHHFVVIDLFICGEALVVYTRDVRSACWQGPRGKAE